MKQMIAFIAVLMAFGYNANSQNTVTPAPAGFDILLTGIPPRENRYDYLQFQNSR